MLIHNYYDKSNYPLQYFHYRYMPKAIKNTIEKLNNKFDLIIRGGLSYILLTNDYNYSLKDIDLAMKVVDTEAIFEEIKEEAEQVYYNKNTFGNDVLTLFWKAEKNYFKIDILLVEQMPNNVIKKFNLIDKSIKVMDSIELWFNRISKVAEKKLRGHSDQKTLHHYRVVLKLSEFLLEEEKIRSNLIDSLSLKKVNNKVSDSISVLNNFLNPTELEEYKNIIENVIKKIQGG